MGAAIAGAVVGAAGIAVGAAQNASAARTNDARFQISRDDYERRLSEAAEGAERLAAAYQAIVDERPGTTWEDFMKSWYKSVSDPVVRDQYRKMKEDDFQTIRNFVDIATRGNVDNFRSAFDLISNGKGDEIVDLRNDLVFRDDTNQRFTRALQLRSPGIGADTVRYDSSGKLVEGQRADKQAFSIAYDTVVETNRERLANVSVLERDRMNAAESQREKAGAFLNFYDSTGYSTSLFATNRTEQMDFQKLDEGRAFELYKLFAAASTGITPAQPSYVPGNPGDAAITSGMQLAGSAIGTYAAQSRGNTGSGNSGTYS